MYEYVVGSGHLKIVKLVTSQGYKKTRYFLWTLTLKLGLQNTKCKMFPNYEYFLLVKQC